MDHVIWANKIIMGVLQQEYIDIVGFLIPGSISSNTLKFHQHSQSTTLLKPKCWHYKMHELIKVSKFNSMS
jgi:hypothetical protein